MNQLMEGFGSGLYASGWIGGIIVGLAIVGIISTIIGSVIKGITSLF